MSAYGTTITAPISRPIDLLPPTIWELPEPTKPAAPFRRLSLYHLRLDDARALPSLVEYTHRVFAAEVEAGQTYPQEALPYTREVFEALVIPGGSHPPVSDPHANRLRCLGADRR